ncbi:hypothetical protein KY285_026833 [Solanum tuberosum]|nr:hypothetical protein KY285_026833 [Solanum tuberosum]
MMVVVVLLNLNCFAQYALCGLNWGYKRSERPATVVGICLLVAVLAPAIAGVYCTRSPLGKDYDTELDKDSQVQKIAAESSCASQPRRIPLEKKFSFASDKGRVVETRPQWSGGSSIWLLFLCLFGLLYGGFWRIRMRKRYNLPPYNTCCGKPYVADCALWLFCCCCSLAQEVRTGNSYDIVEDKFRRKDENISPLPREDGRYEYTSGPSLPTIKKQYIKPQQICR